MFSSTFHFEASFLFLKPLSRMCIKIAVFVLFLPLLFDRDAAFGKGLTASGLNVFADAGLGTSNSYVLRSSVLDLLGTEVVKIM